VTARSQNRPPKHGGETKRGRETAGRRGKMEGKSLLHGFKVGGEKAEKELTYKTTRDTEKNWRVKSYRGVQTANWSTSAREKLGEENVKGKTTSWRVTFENKKEINRKASNCNQGGERRGGRFDLKGDVKNA